MANGEWQSAETKLGQDHPAVLKHLDFLQGIITRMAQNSANCKNWSLIISAALFTLLGAAAKGVSSGMDPRIWSLTLLPVLFLMLLDAYYLFLERDFRGGFISFIERLQKGEITNKTVFHFGPAGGPKPPLRLSLGKLVFWLLWSVFALLGVILVWKWNLKLWRMLEGFLGESTFEKIMGKRLSEQGAGGSETSAEGSGSNPNAPAPVPAAPGPTTAPNTRFGFGREQMMNYGDALFSTSVLAFYLPLLSVCALASGFFK